MEQYLSITFFVLFFIMGIFFERYVITSHSRNPYSDDKPQDFFYQNRSKKKQNNVYIDEAKVVSKINTNNIESKHKDVITNNTETVNDTKSSINKLKEIKGMKNE